MLPSVADTMELMLNLRGDVWLLWGLLATFNTALIGWLLEKGGAFGNLQKAVATVGYALFCLVIAAGFANTYGNLAAAAEDLKLAVSSETRARWPHRRVSRKGLHQELDLFARCDGRLVRVHHLIGVDQLVLEIAALMIMHSFGNPGEVI